MFWKLLLKEWREKGHIFIFSIGIYMIFVLVYLNYSRYEGLTLFLFYGILLIFIPLLGTLLGSSAFFSEFRDEAWNYLFSRPIKKWKIWITKYLSLLTILIAVSLIYFLIVLILPGLLERIATDSFPALSKGSLNLLIFSFYIPLIAFTIAFSLSFLSEKPFIIIFITLFIAVAMNLFLYSLHLKRGYALPLFSLISLYFILKQITNFTLLLPYFFQYQGLMISWLLVGLSFIAASILTFIKADLSQSRKKKWLFFRWIFIFLVISLGLSTVWTYKRGYYRFLSRPQIYEGEAYFSAHRSLFKYDIRDDKLQRILRHKHSFYNGEFVVGADKVLFFDYKKRKGVFTHELWSMNTDNSQKKCLLKTSQAEDPSLSGSYLGHSQFSPEGRRVAFTSTPWSRRITPTLWWINMDGTGLRSKKVDFPQVKFIRLLGWSEFDDSLLLVAVEKYDERSPGTLETKRKLVRFSLKTESFEILTENFRKPKFFELAPQQNMIAFTYFDETNSKESIALLNLETLEKKDVFKAESIDGALWSNNGEKLALSAGEDKLFVYSLPDDKIEEIIRQKSLQRRFMLGSVRWAFDDQNLVLGEFLNGEAYLRILNIDKKKEKRIRIPFPLQDIPVFWISNKVALIRDYIKNQLWRMNLETEAWRRVY